MRGVTPSVIITELQAAGFPDQSARAVLAWLDIEKASAIYRRLQEAESGQRWYAAVSDLLWAILFFPLGTGGMIVCYATSAPQQMWAASGTALAGGFMFFGRGLTRLSTVPLPGWAPLFVIPCLLSILFGWCSPVHLIVGGVGAIWCMGVARELSVPVRARVLFCLAITLTVWAIFVAILILLWQFVPRLSGA